MSSPNKSNKKFIFANRYPHNGPNINSTQGSRHEISVLENASTTSVKRPHSDRNDNTEGQPSPKKPKVKNDVPRYKSPLLAAATSCPKNIANKRLQELRRSLVEKRSTVEREINERLNKTFTENKTKSSKEVAFQGTSSLRTSSSSAIRTSGSSSIQSRLKIHKSSNDVRNNNFTITSPNINTLTDDKVEIKSAQFRFSPVDENSSDNNTNIDDSMEWESIDEATVLSNVFWFGSVMFQWSFMARQLVTDINQIRKEITYDKKLPIDDILNNSDPLPASQNGVCIVVDTNVFLSQLNVIVQLRNHEFQGFNRVTIIVPWMVLQELDYMKEKKGYHLIKSARRAVNYINEQLMLNDPYFKGQTVLEASKQEMCSNNADDGILHCCMQLSDKTFVILLSNDINLRNKVLVNKIKAYNSNSIMENLNKLHASPSNEKHSINIDKIKIILSNLLSHIIEQEMRKAYGEIWLKMVKTHPPYTMDEALNVMYKYWVSVFSFSLQKQAQQRIEEFILFSKRLKNDKHSTQDTYNKFMELSLTLCIYLKNGYPCYKFVIVDALSNIQKCGQ